VLTGHVQYPADENVAGSSPAALAKLVGHALHSNLWISPKVFIVEPGQKEEMAGLAESPPGLFKAFPQPFAQSVLSATNSFSAHGV
jgi:hypothetical protein